MSATRGETVYTRVARLLHIQRRLTNARGARAEAAKRADDELLLILAVETQRVEREREAAILMLGETVGTPETPGLGDAECIACGGRFFSAEGHPTVALGPCCWKRSGR